jgi:uncharacterized protein
LEDIIEKLGRKHGILPVEVRQVFENHPHFRYVEKGHRPGEKVYYASGQTDEGRYLIIFFVYKKDRHALILSARNMTRAERRKYEQS